MEQMAMEQMTAAPVKSGKIQRYKWSVQDKPGRMMILAKQNLFVDDEYQRRVNHNRVLAMARDWSWLACGAITVAWRAEDSTYYVIDGQHRVAAALQRGDIDALPCLVFESTGVASEAGGFVQANTNRKAITGVAKFRALLVSGDPTAATVERLVQSIGRQIREDSNHNTVRCIIQLARHVERTPDLIERLFPLIADVCKGQILHERILDGLMYIERNLPDGESLLDKRWMERVRRVGYQGLMDAANKSAAFYARGGAKVWAIGMVQALNRNCRIELKLRREVDEE